MEKITGAEALMRSLIAEGVEVIFGYPGGAIMPIYDALHDHQESVKHILVRHEQCAAHAAQGYARVSGKPGVAFATSGPGATNLVTGIADALLDSVPLVCITGQVPKHLLGTDAFQETDIIGITIPITKWNYQVTSAEEIPEIIAKAFFVARSGRPGPVLVDITKNAQVEKVAYNYKPYTSLESYQIPHVPDPEDIATAAKLIEGSQRPLILAGHGVLIAKAEQELINLAERCEIPVACTLHGLSAFPTGHRLYAGMLGMHGNYGANLLTNKADLIIAVGMRFDDRVTGDLSRYARNAKVIHLEIDPAEVNKNVKADVALVGDAKQSLLGITAAVASGQHKEWLAEFAQCDQVEMTKVIAPALEAQGELLNMVQVVRALSDATAGEAVVVADVGQHQMMAARYYRFAKADSWITSGGLGTMGFSLPAAMGAKVAAGDRPVLCIVGDGGFQMTLQELATIAQEKLAVKIIILNNNYLGMVRQWQELFFDHRYSSVHLENPDFIAVTKGFRIEAEKVEKPVELADAIERMLKHHGPYLLEVLVEKEGNVFPMVPSGASVSDIRLE